MDPREMNKVLKKLGITLKFLSDEMDMSIQHISGVLNGYYNCLDSFKYKFVNAVVKKLNFDERRNHRLRTEYDNLFIDEDEVFAALERLHKKQNLKKYLEKEEEKLNVKKDIFFSSIKGTEWDIK